MRLSAITLWLGASITAAAAGEISIDEAINQACGSLIHAGDVTSAIQHGEDRVDELILESTKDWIPRFNGFASSDAALMLLAFAEGAHAASDSYAPAVCKVLRPLSAMTSLGSSIDGAGGNLDWGHLQTGATSAAVKAIPERCDFFIYALPPPDPCPDAP